MLLLSVCFGVLDFDFIIPHDAHWLCWGFWLRTEYVCFKVLFMQLDRAPWLKRVPEQDSGSEKRLLLPPLIYQTLEAPVTLCAPELQWRWGCEMTLTSSLTGWIPYLQSYGYVKKLTSILYSMGVCWLKLRMEVIRFVKQNYCTLSVCLSAVQVLLNCVKRVFMCSLSGLFTGTRCT